MPVAPVLAEPLSRDVADVDLVELYFERGWTDGLPVVPPTREKVDAVVAAMKEAERDPSDARMRERERHQLRGGRDRDHDAHGG